MTDTKVAEFNNLSLASRNKRPPTRDIMYDQSKPEGS